MSSRFILRSMALALLTTASMAGAKAQESRLRVKVKADLAAPPDRELGVSKMVYGDEGSFVALKTLGGKRALGGLTVNELGWQLHVIGSEKMAEIKHDQPKFVWGVGPVAIETVETFNKQFRILLSKPDPEHGQLMLLQQVLNPRSLTGRAAAMVAQVPYALFGRSNDYFKPGMTVGFTTTVAADGKHMLIGLTPSTTTHTAGAPIVAVMVDAAMKPLWTKNLVLDGGNASTEVITTIVDKNGAAWYLIKNITDAAPKTKETVGYNYSLYRLDSLGQQAYPLDLGKKDHVQEARAALLPDGTMVCAGTYSNGEANRSESVGIFRSVLNMADGKWAPASRTPFNLREVKKVQRLQANMHMEQIWPKADGGLYAVAERSGMETHLVSDLSGKKIEKTEWVNGNLHVMELGPDGAMKWYTEVPREMSFTNDGPGKTFSLFCQEQLFLFYNDAAANMEPRKKKTPIEPVDKPKEALMLEFRSDGGYKETVVLQEGSRQGYFDADMVWPLGSMNFGLEGAPDFRKDRTFPVLIEMQDAGRR
ncbi:MAG: hypothetical protein IT230_08205 [Flavobacteriales bacterium]|nr:hypothetical protein [Flavobacteriales bacterium]